MIYPKILDKLGDTPMVKIEPKGLDNINLYAKLEGYNPMGSVKDRAAAYMLKKGIESGKINKDTIVIESSSGNLGIALSAYCKEFGLKFYCVVDPHISLINEYIIKTLSTKMIKVTELDENGGYLLNRIKKVQKLLKEIPNSYWINQYGNPYNPEAYKETLGKEICDELNNIDYIFLGVSSGGTVTGLSQKIKEIFPKVKVVAVDIIGSVIFGGVPKKRYIPGIGSSIVPTVLKNAKIDEVLTVDEVSTIRMCHELLKDHNLFVGGSSGSVFSAVKKYFKNKKFKKKPTVVVVFADKGDRYINTVYNKNWCDSFLQKYSEIKQL
ncbi:MAG: Pyridoxal-5'-phosphate-dependent protein subunit beta [Berkelbacteria bacterium GW2011_GWA1_36_9]|uniref:Pyridoxal-5'-phosphate-dependent protein subunit beta n=1 Tax=Berkelbacteria bacterium GW2011_GWA1_36_9 TaxID=1618331 RepID=A0A0G0IP67_9BACT|nr:MAG: Pyridoxal-5'-phosphate-dependent protein subunit beta [Berkelbacteria bacterium GW2011_GWA1_36_9]